MDATNALEKMPPSQRKWVEKLYNFKEKHGAAIDHQTEMAIDTLVAAGAGAAVGLLDKLSTSFMGRDNIIARVPNPLLVGGLAKLAAFAGVGGKKVNDQLHTAGNVGLGIAAYSFTKGLDILKPKGAQASGAADDADALRQGLR